jgi:hypothetical protein
MTFSAPTGGANHQWNLSVSRGDTITTQITTPPAGNISITVTDVTMGLADTDAGTCSSCSGSTGTVSVDSFSPIPKFKPVKWTGVVVDGTPLQSTSPTESVQVNGSKSGPDLNFAYRQRRYVLHEQVHQSLLNALLMYSSMTVTRWE